MENINDTAFILLEDGSLFEGKSIGHKGVTTGEICFNTGMTGYQEIYTDPSYYGQIIINTSAHIGNYGVVNEEVESGKVQIRGVVINSFANTFSRGKALAGLQRYLSDNKIVGIGDIDTRKIVRHVRQKGAMNAVISSGNDVENAKELLRKTPSMEGLELASKVSTKEVYDIGSGEHRVAVVDLGTKQNILRNLASRNCTLRVFPIGTDLSEIMSWNPDGFFISNGPGDPSAMPDTIGNVKKMIETDKPVFGICLGHQMIASSQGIGTYKMHHGHRGLNHPVKNLVTGLSEITSQNHGFSINEKDVEANKDVEVTHVNLNDNTIEGIRIKGKPVFSVQYHPEASPGPHDSHYLFDDFVQLFEKK